MRVKDYIAIVLTIVFVIGVFGCVVNWGTMQFWFAAGVTLMSGATLMSMAEFG